MNSIELDEKLNAFMTALSALTLEHGFVIGGCGCCGSPWVAEQDASCGHYEFDETQDGASLVALRFVVDPKLTPKV